MSNFWAHCRLGELILGTKTGLKFFTRYANTFLFLWVSKADEKSDEN
jgi:hypothetical protein